MYSQCLFVITYHQSVNIDYQKYRYLGPTYTSTSTRTIGILKCSSSTSI